jgi:hypothetical protein
MCSYPDTAVAVVEGRARTVSARVVERSLLEAPDAGRERLSLGIDYDQLVEAVMSAREERALSATPEQDAIVASLEERVPTGRSVIANCTCGHMYIVPMQGEVAGYASAGGSPAPASAGC